MPKSWRKATVTLILKKDKKEDPGNYGPQLDPWQGDEAVNPGNHFQAHE